MIALVWYCNEVGTAAALLQATKHFEITIVRCVRMSVIGNSTVIY